MQTPGQVHGIYDSKDYCNRIMVFRPAVNRRPVATGVGLAPNAFCHLIQALLCPLIAAVNTANRRIPHHQVPSFSPGVAANGKTSKCEMIHGSRMFDCHFGGLSEMGRFDHERAVVSSQAAGKFKNSVRFQT
jgi:hypothetical protein